MQLANKHGKKIKKLNDQNIKMPARYYLFPVRLAKVKKKLHIYNCYIYQSPMWGEGKGGSINSYKSLNIFFPEEQQYDNSYRDIKCKL